LLPRAQGRLAGAAAESWHHAFLGTCLAPRGGGPPGRALAALPAPRHGGVAALGAAVGRVARSLARPRAGRPARPPGRSAGLGVAWLVRRPDGSAGIVVPHGAATPAVGGANPLLACDLWEHAHWIDHHDDRAAWLASFWKVVDWDAVTRRLR